MISSLSCLPTASVTLIIAVENSSIEKRFDLILSVGALKTKLESILGIPPSSQSISYKGSLLSDGTLLGQLSLLDFDVLTVSDLHQKDRLKQYTDVSLVEKFEISQKEYESKSDTVREFKRLNKLGRFKDVTTKEEEEKQEEGKGDLEGKQLGDRCMTHGDGEKRGTVRYMGKLKEKKGYWIGVEYDEPIGKHDGKEYFKCKDKFGVFLRPAIVITGDYPEEDLFNDDDEM